ncbi:YjcQ family protein [Lactococcus insecticola]|uniref:YjcQ protein n=1 Tax=Pseudolactococcus insecticola TaxID=2709158 RepID=A0A6A0B5M9_9LACT|nr:YjcQ family protein [Lactococcus insecticola]GFH39841.1 hypothetical protein Hs20B_02390 [Lactococcus insecticola]
MAKDDYHVIVYQILKYLYESLKNGTEIDFRLLEAGNFGIYQKYWLFIMKSMKEQGFVSGVRIIGTQGRLDIKRIEITPSGIDYLLDDNLMSKAEKAYNNVKDFIPLLPGL